MGDNLKIYIDKSQINAVIKDLNLTYMQAKNLAQKTFKRAVNEFYKRVLSRVNREGDLKKNKAKQRIKKYVFNNMTGKLFNGLFNIGLTNWKNARENKRGVSYKYGGETRTRKGAFIRTMPEGGEIAVRRTGKYNIATKGSYKGKRREMLEKQVEDPLPIFEQILQDEMDNFLNDFINAYSKELDKIVK